MAKQQEAKIKTDLMMEKIGSGCLKGEMSFKALITAYLADQKIQRQPIYLGLHQIEWVGSTDEPLLDRDPVPQNGSRWLGCIVLYCESRDSGF